MESHDCGKGSIFTVSSNEGVKATAKQGFESVWKAAFPRAK